MPRCTPHRDTPFMPHGRCAPPTMPRPRTRSLGVDTIPEPGRGVSRAPLHSSQQKRSAGYLVFGAGYLVLGIWSLVLSTGYLELGRWCSVLGRAQGGLRGPQPLPRAVGKCFSSASWVPLPGQSLHPVSGPDVAPLSSVKEGGKARAQDPGPSQSVLPSVLLALMSTSHWPAGAGAGAARRVMPVALRVVSGLSSVPKGHASLTGAQLQPRIPGPRCTSCQWGPLAPR